MKATIKKSRSTDKQIVVTNGRIKIAEIEDGNIKPTGKLSVEQIKAAIRPQRGAASILIELEDGVITVYHGSDGSVLYRKVAINGDWDKIWTAIRFENI